jgi:ABC-type nitrate/sulfonate/bicarbonate transport system ATPase subunit
VSTVTFEGVSKEFANGFRAVEDLDLEVGDGELLVVVGPSGCGKTTTLRMLAGLEDITEGKIMIGQRVVNDVAARDRDIAMVFQSYALYPHLSVTATSPIHSRSPASASTNATRGSWRLPSSSDSSSSSTASRGSCRGDNASESRWGEPWSDSPRSS